MITFKFKTKYGFTKCMVKSIGKRIKFELSALKGFRPFPIVVIAEYNRTLLKRNGKASIVLSCESNKLSAFEAIRLKEKASELLPVPDQAIDLIFERISKRDYSVIK